MAEAAPAALVPPVAPAPVAVPAPAVPAAPTAEAKDGEKILEGQRNAARTAGGVHTGATLTEDAAVAIFVAKHTHTTRDSLSCKLAIQYGITSKSVRDIWNLRTWGWATLPHWSTQDKNHFVASRLCNACRRRGVDSIEAACERCTVTKRRGRPPGIKETKPRNRTGLSRNASLDDDAASANLAINMQVQNPMGLPVLFNAPNQLLLQQHMVQQMSQRGSGGFPAEMWNPMMQQRAGSGAQGSQGQNGQLNGNISFFLPQYAMPPGQEGMAFGMMQTTDMNGQPVMVPGPAYGYAMAPHMMGAMPGADAAGAPNGSGCEEAKVNAIAGVKTEGAAVVTPLPVPPPPPPPPQVEESAAVPVSTPVPAAAAAAPPKDPADKDPAVA